MGADIRQRYDDLDTTTTSVLRNIDLAAGSPAISGDIVMFSGICSSAGTEIALATSTLQTTGNAILTTMDADTGAIATSVASIDTKTPSLGQALAAASVPVVLTAAQISTLTPPAAITGFALLTEQQTQTGHLVTLIGHVDGVEGSLTNAVTALQIMDDWDETNRCAVNLIVGQAGITAAAGAVAANTPRVTLGSDDPAVVSLQLIDDSIYTVGSVPSVTKGVMIVGKFSSDGSIQPLSVTDEGKAEVAAHLYAGGGPVPTGNGAAGGVAQRVTIANDSTGILAGVTTVTTVTTCSTLTGGGVAHDGVDSGNPHKIGAKATTALSGKSLVIDNDRTDLFAGIDGVQITRPHCNLEDIVSGVAAITDGSSTSVIAAAGSGVKVYVTSVIIANSSATAVTVDIRDGAAGTVKATFPVPPDGGGVVHAFQVPLPFSANTAVCADPSAAASTVTVTLLGFKSKV